MTPLSTQLQATANAVACVLSGRPLDQALDGLPSSLRSGVQALSFAVLRNWGMASELLNVLVPKPPKPPVQALLGTALALAQCRPDAGTHYTEFTLVNQAVEAAKSQRETRAAANLINAVLRRFLRDKSNLLQAASCSEMARHNHPTWWINKVRQDHPTAWEQVLSTNNQAATLCLRINTSRVTPEQYGEALLAQGIKYRLRSEKAVLHASGGKAHEAAIYIAESVRVQELPGYAQGHFFVQDASAQMAAPLLLSEDFVQRWKQRVAHLGQTAHIRHDDVKRQGIKLRILDACAAPGGKTTHLLECMDKAGLAQTSHLTALEVDAQRAKKIHENLQRMFGSTHDEQTHVCVADAGQPDAWWDGVHYDAILLDAPCSASGIVRRHPDIRWLRRDSDIETLQKKQMSLLKSLWPLLAPNGRLLYATCSVFHAEGHDVVQAFCATQPDANWLDSPLVILPRAPVESDPQDGFFYALLEKNAVATHHG